ncbi:structural maintenance of chromosomes 4-like protein gluon [Arctopsyche grandis]|uniref:structural maintenance of chromosomes 4-like protein gluon n=1 Tax=Arctopsyche grandis TaxID=121162 RepID=UPI00406D9D1B
MMTSNKKTSDDDAMEVDIETELAQVAHSTPSVLKVSPVSRKSNVAPSKRNAANDDDEFDHLSDDEEGGIRVGDIYIPPAPKPTLSTENTGPRLIITKIVNHNFKSYAGTQVLGPFHKSFTAIIGPNGSGKSNVIDSMLFVFGYRASKIRSKKISVLLHSSNKFPHINSATVEVHFVQITDMEGENEYEILPNTELVVARSAFKDNSSFYMLNGKRVHFKEVAKVLKSHGIDLVHNRFLILQGEVEQIAMMKAKAQNEHETGMLEYLEDIVGTSRFKEPIEKLSVHVEDLSEARKEKLNRVRLVEAEKQKLEGPMKEAMEQLNILNNFTRAKNTLLQKYIHSTNKKVQLTLADKEKYQDSLKELDDNMTEVRSEKDEKNKFLTEKNKKYENLEKRKEELNDTFRKMKSKDVTLQTNTTEMSKRKKNIEGVLEQEKGKLINFEQIPEKSRRDIEECKQLMEKLSEEKETQEEDLKEFMKTMSSETKGLQEHKDKEQSRLIELTKIRDETKKNFKLAESELKIYMSTEESEKEKLADYKKSLEDAIYEVQDNKTKFNDITKILPKKEIALKEAKTTYATLKEDETKLSNKMRNLRNQVEESKNAFSANKHSNMMLDALMNQKRTGAIPGIFGRLGDLGAIDQKYDVAISTCCPTLDNLVVDTASTAQKCIEFLKANNLGRATFIAAEKQEHLRQYFNANTSFPENAPRLFDLVRVSDDRIKPVFYYALHDTLVANDIDQASRISFHGKRHRVVTLGGEVFEVVGTISGGGNTVIRGKIGSKVQIDDSVDPAVLQAQERELVSVGEKLNDMRAQIPELEQKISSLTRECSELKFQKDKLAIECKSLEERIPLLKTQIKEQTDKVKNCAVDLKHKSSMEKKTKDLELYFEKANLDCEKVEKIVNEIHEKIVSAGSGKYKKLQTGIDELVQRIDKVQKEITRLNVAIKTSERNGKKSTEKIDQMEKEISDLEEKLKKIKEEKKELTLDGAKIQKCLEEIEEQLSERNSEFGDLKEEITKLTKQENKLKSDRLEITSNIAKVEKAADDLKSKIPSWKRELASLLLETVDIPGQEPPSPLSQHTPEELDCFKVDELQSKVAIQEERLGDQKPNLQAILEYKAKEESYLQRANELEEITNKRNEARNIHDELRKKRHNEFLAGFNTITAKLKEMYQMITLGGDAELELVDSLDPFTEGIVFSVRPPNKSWKTISNLSGGEKTLSSLALVFALHYYKPTPLYVMDEIDAALDFKNVSIVANYIKERTKNAQFIIISLRYNMFELANRLVGIYKTNDCTKSVTIQNNPGLAVSNEANARST